MAVSSPAVPSPAVPSPGRPLPWPSPPKPFPPNAVGLTRRSSARHEPANHNSNNNSYTNSYNNNNNNDDNNNNNNNNNKNNNDNNNDNQEVGRGKTMTLLGWEATSASGEEEFQGSMYVFFLCIKYNSGKIIKLARKDHHQHSPDSTWRRRQMFQSRRVTREKITSKLT